MTNRVKAMRGKRKITQNKLSELSKVSRVFISGIENDKKNPSIGTMKKIANALDCTVDDLLADEQHSP